MSEKQDQLIITKGPREGEIVPLANLPMVIGRDNSAEVEIKIDSVSRKHARISKSDSGYVVEDLNSVNGTFVNGEKIESPHQIRNDDLISLGPDCELRVVIFSAQESDATAFIISPSRGKGAGDGEATAFMRQPVQSEGTVAFRKDMHAALVPPRLVISESGKEPRIVTLTANRVRIGRQEDNDIVLDNRFISRHHAELEKRGQEYFIIPTPNVSNPLLLDGQPLMEPTQLKNGSKIRVGGFEAGELIAIDYLSPASEGQQAIKFTDNSLMTIGRDPSNKIVLSAPAVSRFHAEVEKVGQRYRVRDLRSSNGTFVNGEAVTGERWVHPGDAIQIGPYRFAVAEGEFSQTDQSEGVSVDMIGLNKWVSKSLNILQDISIAFKPKEFIVVVGQSGGGKSTLVDAIAGYRPATQGKVIVNDSIDVYKEFDAIRSNIGYVPQKDIIHMELTVFQALSYAARLRMPADTTPAERNKRIEEVMEDLDLSHRRNTPISRLSGGQQKRVSIGVELLTKPGLFFLDEPTSGLDPGMETELMRLMRRLADQGRTVVMITHATKNVMLADKVVFLARGGFLAWFGPPEEALTYFDKFRSERDRRAGAMEFDHIYTLLDKDELGSGADWAKRYKESDAYQKYVASQLADKEKKDSRKLTKPIAQRKQSSAWRQFLILSERNIKILTSDVFSLILLILIAPLMASLDFVLASGVGKNPTGFVDGNFNQMVVTLISITNTSVLVGGLAMMRELVKEREVYKRERRVNLQLSSYILSKTWLAVILALYQAACFTVIRYLAFEMPGGNQEKLFFFITEFLLVLSGTIVGLFCSALAPSANAAPLLLILFIIPQMVLSGALVQLPETMTSIAPMRWAFQSYVGISGAGSDVAGDACWNMTKEEQDNMTLEQKNKDCTCMGENALREDSCNFPGLGKYYTDALDTADPIKPTEPGPEPTEPVLPTEPAKPENPNDLQALQLYLQDLTTYNDKVSKLQDDYKKAINDWQDEQDTYKSDMETYQKNLTDLKVKRATAVGSAESTIRRFKEQYGWTFVDKNSDEYLKTLIKTWVAQIIICIVLFMGTVLMQKHWESV